jgi:two-component system NarL family sensor kinase
MRSDAERDTLREALARVTPHDHLCSIHESLEEAMNIAVPFIQIGLERGEQCIYIVNDSEHVEVTAAMTSAGIDVERALAGRGLMLVPWEGAYLRPPLFDATATLAFWKDAATKAAQSGFRALRIIGTPDWVYRGAAGTEKWRRYECELTRLLGITDCSALCQYDRTVCPPEIVLDVIRTHSTVIYRQTVCQNPYYVPPDELLGDGQVDREVDRQLAYIRDHELIESELRRSEALLRLVLDALPVGTAVTDRAGNITLVNPASRRIWGRTLPLGRERHSLSNGFWHDTGERVLPEEWGSARALAAGESSFDERIDIDAFDGIRKTIRNSAVPIRDSSGAITGSVIVNEDITSQVEAERALDGSLRRLRALTRRLMGAQDDERRRIAQMLHETTAQDLAALKMILARASRAAGLQDDERELLAESIALADRSMSDIRTLSYVLHPPFLDEMGLVSALRWYADGFAKRSGIRLELELPERFARLSPETETALFRVVQEALINIHRHAASESASIRLRQDDQGLVLEIEDRGRGIAATDLERTRSGGGAAGVGIATMRERLEQLGGRLTITSDERGTMIRAALPHTIGEEADVGSHPRR